MLYYTLKILLSSFSIVAVSEIAKRSSLPGALLLLFKQFAVQA